MCGGSSRAPVSAYAHRATIAATLAARFSTAANFGLLAEIDSVFIRRGLGSEPESAFLEDDIESFVDLDHTAARANLNLGP